LASVEAGEFLAHFSDLAPHVLSFIDLLWRVDGLPKFV
jgi:hypothetical protein